MKFDRWMEKRLEACFWFFPFVLLHVHISDFKVHSACSEAQAPTSSNIESGYTCTSSSTRFLRHHLFWNFFLFIIFGHYVAAFVKSSGADNNPLILHLQHYVNQIPVLAVYCTAQEKMNNTKFFNFSMSKINKLKDSSMNHNEKVKILQFQVPEEKPKCCLFIMWLSCDITHFLNELDHSNRKIVATFPLADEFTLGYSHSFNRSSALRSRRSPS